MQTEVKLFKYSKKKAYLCLALCIISFLIGIYLFSQNMQFTDLTMFIAGGFLVVMGLMGTHAVTKLFFELEIGKDSFSVRNLFGSKSMQFSEIKQIVVFGDDNPSNKHLTNKVVIFSSNHKIKLDLMRHNKNSSEIISLILKRAPNNVDVKSVIVRTYPYVA